MTAAGEVHDHDHDGEVATFGVCRHCERLRAAARFDGPATGAAVSGRRVRAVCRLCGQPVDDLGARDVHRRVTGWEQRRRAGGTNALRLRQVHDEWAHGLCVDRARNGVLHQEALALPLPETEGEPR